VTDGAAFAALLTPQMRGSKPRPAPNTGLQPSPSATAPDKTNAGRPCSLPGSNEAANCTFERVEILPHNIGYLKLNSFPDVSVCQRTHVVECAHLCPVSIGKPHGSVKNYFRTGMSQKQVTVETISSSEINRRVRSRFSDTIPQSVPCGG